MHGCKGLIDLSRPIRQEKVRGFQPPWRTVFIYVCPLCSTELRMCASRFMGGVATPELGAVRCERPHEEEASDRSQVQIQN